MTRYTVQLGYAAYYAHTEVVDADTLDEALTKAVEQANASSEWESLDDCGSTFVDAVAVGDDVDLWSDAVTQLPIPAALTERGEGPRVIVIVSGGVVQNVASDCGYARVEVRDYDTDGADLNDPNIRIDAEGRRYTLSDWSNVIPAHEGAG
ncbi:MAG: hypothetical protein KGJ79_11690 [Alphaproteobacteria bacterium]|nr:hypothetical protein [Alphaproteobacteria bacterium]MDE2111795.1 hypothetical protein [Alphaproteobacteria bacterium]MDE2493081.1 hypothetical protein [Alphaproteobacteria bacterium]